MNPDSEPRIGLVQMVSSQDVDKNLKRTESLLSTFKTESVGAIFLPENFAALASPDPLALGQAEYTTSGPIRSFLREMAVRLETWIFAGTLPTTCRIDGSTVSDDRVRAASIVYDQKGREVSRYDKMHMFDVDVEDNHRRYRESDTFEAGGDVVSVDSPIGKVGLSVCYDIRFPELYRQLALQEVQHLAVPSAFTTTTGEAHWQLLMRSRAVENACFTIGACQGGRHDSGRETHGHSMVVDPWGDVVAELGKGEDVLVVSLNMSEQKRIRRDMPTLSQRKLL